MFRRKLFDGKHCFIAKRISSFQYIAPSLNDFRCVTLPRLVKVKSERVGTVVMETRTFLSYDYPFGELAGT